jgi:hypothetical protein
MKHTRFCQALGLAALLMCPLAYAEPPNPKHEPTLKIAPTQSPSVKMAPAAVKDAKQINQLPAAGVPGTPVMGKDGKDKDLKGGLGVGAAGRDKDVKGGLGLDGGTKDKDAKGWGIGEGDKGKEGKTGLGLGSKDKDTKSGLGIGDKGNDGKGQGSATPGYGDNKPGARPVQDKPKENPPPKESDKPKDTEKPQQDKPKEGEKQAAGDKPKDGDKPDKSMTTPNDGGTGTSGGATPTAIRPGGAISQPGRQGSGVGTGPTVGIGQDGAINPGENTRGSNTPHQRIQDQGRIVRPPN